MDLSQLFAMLEDIEAERKAKEMIDSFDEFEKLTEAEKQNAVDRALQQAKNMLPLYVVERCESFVKNKDNLDFLNGVGFALTILDIVGNLYGMKEVRTHLIGLAVASRERQAQIIKQARENLENESGIDGSTDQGNSGES